MHVTQMAPVAHIAHPLLHQCAVLPPGLRRAGSLPFSQATAPAAAHGRSPKDIVSVLGSIVPGPEVGEALPRKSVLEYAMTGVAWGRDSCNPAPTREAEGDSRTEAVSSNMTQALPYWQAAVIARWGTQAGQGLGHHGVKEKAAKNRSRKWQEAGWCPSRKHRNKINFKN